MKLIDKIIQRTKAYKTADNEAKAAKAEVQNALTFFRANSRTVTRSQAEALLGISFSCMNKRANEVARSETLVGRWDKDDNFIKEPEHWLSNLLYMPNEKTKMTWHDMKYLISMWLDYTGNAYVWTPMYNGAVKQPVDIWVLPSNLIEIVPGTQGRFIDGYKLKYNSNILLLPAEEICHIKTYAVSNDLSHSLYRGKAGIIDSIAPAIANDAELMGFIEKYFERQAFPPLFYRTVNNLSAEQWQRVKSEFEQKLPDAAFKGILEGDSDVRPLDVGSKDAANLFRGSISEELYARIAQAFEVPKSLLEMEYKDTRSIKSVMYEFKASVIDQILKRIEAQLTMHFRQWDDTIAITHEPYVFQENLLQVNDPKTGELLTFVPQGWVPIQTAVLPQAAQQTSEPQETPKGLKSYEIKADMEAVWMKNDGLNRQGASKIETPIVKTFNLLEKDILKNLPKKIKSTGKIRIKREISAELFDIEEWKNKIKDASSGDLKEHLDEIFESALNDIGENWDKVRSQFEDDMAKALRSSSDKIADSINTIHEDLKDTIQKLIDDNPTDSSDELLDKIKEATSDKFSEVYTESRAKMIAQTTSTYALGQGQSKSWNKFGFDAIWLSQRDGNVRDSHRAADGQYRVDGKFTVGGDTMEHPGAGSIAEENVNCRCSMFPVKDKMAIVNGRKYTI